MNKKMFLKLLGNIWKTVWEQVKTSFRFRVTGGEENIKLSEYNGRAEINRIYGNTVKWNQLSQNPSFDTLNNWAIINPSSVKSYTVNNNVLTIVKKQGILGGMFYNEVNGDTTHKYYMSVVGKVNENTSAPSKNVTRIGICLSTGIMGTNKQVANNSTEFIRLSLITSPVHSSDRFFIGLGDSDTPSNVIGYLKNYRLIDITSIFGTDSQIASALGIQEADITTDIGVAAFEKWLELNPGEQEYYPYDPGSLINFNGSGIKGVGFNLWDEQWEVGGINPSTGENVANSTVIRSKNYIPCFPSTKYYFKGPTTINFGGTRFYDLGMNYIGGIDSAVVSNSEFETPSNCRFIRIQSTVDYGPTYKNDICINLSNLNKNGTYEPYWTDSSDLSFIYSIKDTNNNILFPNGLCSAGSVYDEVTETQAIKRVGSVNLKQLGFNSISTSTTAFQSNEFPIAKRNNSGLPQPGLFCIRYTPTQTTQLAINLRDHEMTVNARNRNTVIISDVNYTDATTFTNSLEGIILNYELATPIIVPLTPEQRMRYKASKYGTEEVCYPVELEYIESTGTQYIDTGITPNSTKLQVNFKMQNLANVYQSFFGAVANPAPRVGYRIFRLANNSYFSIQSGTDSYVDANFNDPIECQTTVNNGGSITVVVNGRTTTVGSGVNTQFDRSMLIFTAALGSDSISGTGAFKLWSFQIIKDDEEKFNGIPCLDPNGVVCMYDKVSRSFFYNQGTGDFIAGPIVSGNAPTSTGIIADINYQHKGGYGNQPIELEYIESTGTQYIDTGLTAGSNTRILAQYKLKNITFTLPILVRDENTAGAGFGVGVNGSQQFISDYNGDRQVFTTITPNTTDTITVDKNKNVCTITIGGQSETVTNAVSTFTTTNTLPFFATSSAGVVGSGRYVFYSFKMWNNDVLVRDLVPYIDQDGVVCMYDKVSRSFFYNQRTGDFIAGPAKDLPGGGIES